MISGYATLLALVLIVLSNESAANETDEVESSSKPWGSAIGAALIVNLASLIGVIVVAFATFTRSINKNSGGDYRVILRICLPSFASGALLASSVFLIIPEALELMEQEGENAEAQRAWKFGASVLGGYMLPLVLGSLFPHGDHAPIPPPVVTATEHEDEEENSGATENDKVDEPSTKIINYRLASSLLIGDFFHNFADGFFIGNAFLLCGPTIAWIVVSSTIFHELSQELADFFLLVNQCGLSPLKALAFNLLSGLSVMMGVVVILATDVTDVGTGSILAMSAGVYIYISAGECQPRVEKEIHTLKDRLIAMLFFVAGCIPIGLVLLNHKHCEVDHEDH